VLVEPSHSLKIHRSRCVDNIKVDLIKFNGLAVVKVVMNRTVPSKIGNFCWPPERESASEIGPHVVTRMK
jgi:hypothetical protein